MLTADQHAARALGIGVHDIPIADYLADPCLVPSLSRGVAQALLEESPLHAWAKHPRLNLEYVREHDKKFDLGTAVHDVLLEGGTDKIWVIDAKDYRTKVSQETREEAYAAGKVPVLVEQMTEIEVMVKAAQEVLAQTELAAMFTPTGGMSERTLIWKEGESYLRTRPDRVSNDWVILADYKSTSGSAEPNAWMKGPMLSNGCDLQAALGLRAVNALKLSQHTNFIFVVQENYPPYAVSLVGFGEQFKFYADARLNHAIKLWDQCLSTGVWPGYSSKVSWVSPPVWKTAEWDEQLSKESL